MAADEASVVKPMTAADFRSSAKAAAGLKLCTQLCIGKGAAPPAGATSVDSARPDEAVVHSAVEMTAAHPAPTAVPSQPMPEEAAPSTLPRGDLGESDSRATRSHADGGSCEARLLRKPPPRERSGPPVPTCAEAEAAAAGLGQPASLAAAAGGGGRLADDLATDAASFSGHGNPGIGDLHRGFGVTTGVAAFRPAAARSRSDEEYEEFLAGGGQLGTYTV